MDYFFCCIFIPGEGGVDSVDGTSGFFLPQRHYCLGERTGHLLPFLRHVYEWDKNVDSLLGPFWKVFLFFTIWDFYGTDSIPDKEKKNTVEVILFFKYNCSYYVQEGWTVYRQAATLQRDLRQTLGVTHRRRFGTRLKYEDGMNFFFLSELEVFWRGCRPLVYLAKRFNDKEREKLIRSYRIHPPQKRIAIKLQSELFMVLSLLFFIVILVKKKEEKKEEDSYTIRTMLY